MSHLRGPLRRPHDPILPMAQAMLFSVLALSMAGCGISMRYVVESDMRFEHCYRLDEDGRTALDDKKACWREWTATYQKGQDRSRVAYATERLRVLDAASPGAIPTHGAGGGSSVVLASTAGGAAPLSPYAPPPSTASNASKGAINAVTESPTWQLCSDGCSTSWKACAPGCNGQMSCVGTCEERYRVCMKACF